MTQLLLKIKVWSKVGIISLVTIYILLFIYKNSDNSANLWVFINNERQTSVLWLTVTAFILGAAVALLAKTLYSTITQFKQLKAQRAHEDLKKSVADMQAKASMLQTKPSAEEKKSE
jgi:lysylphosphatidylglycerol synthetase-like protein (DUF2156 family)